MTKKLWFRAKTYGWGWAPCSWEGWLVLAFFILMIIWSVSKAEINSESPLYIFVRVFLIVAILIFICYKKGEKPGWRWGRK